MKPAWFRAAAVLAVLLPCTTLAFEWNGRAGLLYSREDQYTPATGGTTIPRLDVDLALDGAGYIYSPDALSWGAGVGYRRYTTSPSNAASSSQNMLNYRLRSTAFGRRGSPFTLSGYASRSEGDGSAAAGSYGTTEQTYGGSAQLMLLNRPGATFGYSHSEGTYTSPLYPSHESKRDAFDAGTGYSTTAFGYDVHYLGNLSTGTYDSENYDDHRVDVVARVSAFKDVSLTMSDSYYRRVPTRTSGFNPRQEMNSYSAQGRHESVPGVSTEQVRYAHSDALSESQSAVISRALDTLDLEIRRPLSEKEWSLVTTASASYSDTAVDYLATPDERLRTAGQALSAVAHWARQVEDVRWRAHAGPSVGVVEPFDGTTEFGWGASAGGSVQRQFARVLAGAQYSLAYSKAVGTLTTSLAQNAATDAEGAIGAGRLRGLVAVSSERSNTPGLGSTASRSLRGNLDYGQRSYGAFAEVQLRDGVAYPLRDPFRGDGLFLSPGYDSRSTSLTGGLRGGYSGLTAQTSLRLTSVVMPDRPDRDDLEARAEVSYRLGAFGIGFDERYLISLRDRTRANVVFFRVYRLLGSRY